MSSNTIIVLSGLIAIGVVWVALMTGACAVLIRASLASPPRTAGPRQRHQRSSREAAAARTRRAPAAPGPRLPPATA